MSFLNGAELCINFKPATAQFLRKMAHIKKMDAKRRRSPSRVLVAEQLGCWRKAWGYDENSPIYPGGVDMEDFTALVKWAKARRESQDAGHAIL